MPVKIRFLPQATRIIEINLDSKNLLDVLEKRFAAINKECEWQEDFLDELFFQRGDDQFRIDTSISAGRGGSLGLVAFGFTESLQGTTRLTLDYSIQGYGLEIFFRVVVVFLCLFFTLITIAWMASGFSLQVLLFFLPFVPVIGIGWIIRSGYETGIIELHHEIYTTLSQIRSL